MLEKNATRTTRMQKQGFFSSLSLGLTIHELSKLVRHCLYDNQRLADHLNLTKRQLERIFQSELGRSPRDWINEIRLLDSREMLIDLQSIKQVAILLGFKQESHFCREFKRVHGITPREYIALHLENNEGETKSSAIRGE